MVTRNVVLTEHQHQLVQGWVESGKYQNASEALRAGLRLLEQEDRERTARLAALTEAARIGWSDLTAGRFDDIADADLDDYLEQLGSRARRPSE
ncbi:type II toxin-antitoxin system ParD family antitoxin [Agrococcus baldri]|uniref:Transcriptional regulator n=1 Tax=Agrococcus baldri TaxID=153730 RepID=A0AA87UTC5_9MICO|nr:type II toxin-antitoxin system ParD family antitoxin [Agrococcus baldri]GEK81345.1 transcriptional regulator [Agrococcus baldri]